MLEILKHEYRKHKTFIMVYIAVCTFLAFFFVSGLRGFDVVRIPKPSLPYEGDEVRQRILHGEIPPVKIRY